MTWVRLEDTFPLNMKVADAGGDAGWLYVCALCYAGSNLTDGVIPKSVLPRLSDRKKPLLLAARLVEVGLWTDEGDAFRIHDYLKFQPTRAKVMEEREKSAERMRLRREAAASSAEVRANTARTSPTTSHPIPSPPTHLAFSHGSSADGHLLDEETVRTGLASVTALKGQLRKEVG